MFRRKQQRKTLFRSAYICFIPCDHPVYYKLTMAYVGVEFDDLVIGLVHYTWLTPRKKETFWPPYKSGAQFKKALILSEEPDENTWRLCNVKRIFFECDDLQKAQERLKKCEEVSDAFSTDVEASSRRRVKQNRKYVSSDSDTEEEHNLLRPPKIFKTSSSLKGILNAKENTLNPVFVPSLEPIATATTSAAGTVAQKSAENSQNSRIPNNQITELNQTELSYTTESSNYAKLFKKLKEIKAQNEIILEQNRQILASLQINQTGVLPTHTLPEGCPNLPLKSLDAILECEEFLKNGSNFMKFVSYMTHFGGKDVTAKTNNVLRGLLNNEIGSIFSFLGTRHQKKSFSALKLCKVVISSVQSSTPNAQVDDIVSAIKVWLKHSPQRLNLERKKAAEASS